MIGRRYARRSRTLVSYLDVAIFVFHSQSKDDVVLVVNFIVAE